MYLPQLKNLREDSDLTQQQIADLLHVGQRCYSYYETGKRCIPLEYLIILADFYQVSLDYITGRTKNKKLR